MGVQTASSEVFGRGLGVDFVANPALEKMSVMHQNRCIKMQRAERSARRTYTPSARAHPWAEAGLTRTAGEHTPGAKRTTKRIMTQRIMHAPNVERRVPHLRESRGRLLQLQNRPRARPTHGLSAWGNACRRRE